MELRYHSIESDVLVIDADGGLNRATAAELVDQIGQLVDAGLRRIVVDCSKVDYISSLGMSALLRLHASMGRRGASVKVCSVRGLAAQALQLMRLDRVFDLHPDLNRALLSFREEREAERGGARATATTPAPGSTPSPDTSLTPPADEGADAPPDSRAT